MKSLNRTFTQLCFAHPETTLTSVSFIGVIFGVILWSIAGWCVGSLMSHPLAGMYSGLGVYSFSLAFTADELSARLDDRIAYVKRMASGK